MERARMTKMNTYEELVKNVEGLLAPSLAQDWPMVPAVRAEGVYLFAQDGRRYLDFTSGIAVTNVGHNHPKVLAAAIEQMKTFSHSAVGITLHEPLLRLAQKLPQVMPEGMEMFFFGNSGSEAIDGSLKMARYVTGRPGIIAFTGGFHGRTFGATSITSMKVKYRRHYEPLLPGVYFAEYPYSYRCPLGDTEAAALEWSLASIEKIFERFIAPDEVAAFLVEPVQGEGGYIVPPDGFLKSLREICDQHGILLILDEVQSGFGRTGEMFAAQVFNVKPDIMAVAKGIANGLPLSAVASTKTLMTRWLAGSHGTTFGGNPVACAAALAVLNVIEEENLLDNCRTMGSIILERFNAFKERFPIIGDARGLGLMTAMEFVVPGQNKKPNPDACMKFLEGCLDRGLIGYMAGLYGQVVRFMPPLNLTIEQAKEALSIMEESMKDI